eukprot:COSAG02_NODE_1204_length_13898_cov_42.005870_9_plen_92_part_00
MVEIANSQSIAPVKPNAPPLSSPSAIENRKIEKEYTQSVAKLMSILAARGLHSRLTSQITDKRKLPMNSSTIRPMMNGILTPGIHVRVANQ